MQLFPSSEQLSIFSEQRCIQMPWCFCHRFPHSTKLRFHTRFWTTILLHQMRFWNQGIVPCQWYPFVLWSTLRSPHANWTPSWLQYCCREVLEPISFFYVSQPSEVARYWPSAMMAYSEAASWSNGKNLVFPSTFMPRQIVVKDVLQ